MGRILGLAAFVLIAGGISGLLGLWLPVPPFFGFLRFAIPGGYEVYGYLACTVLGGALGVAADALSRSEKAREAGKEGPEHPGER